MDRAPARRCRRGLSREGHRVSRGHGGAWALRPALSGVRRPRAAHRLRGERDQLLCALPDGRQAACRPGAIAAAQEKLAALHRRAGLVATARFRFFGDIGQFLAAPKRDAPFEFSCARAASLKNAIEALGVPHTEVGPVTVNGEPATLQRMVRDSDLIEVRPREKEKPGLFLADAHLGGLARFLRMLGYDTLFHDRLQDGEIRRLAGEERRIVLRSEEHTSELQSPCNLVCRLLLEKKK